MALAPLSGKPSNMLSRQIMSNKLKTASLGSNEGSANQLMRQDEDANKSVKTISRQGSGVNTRPQIICTLPPKAPKSQRRAGRDPG